MGDDGESRAMESADHVEDLDFSMVPPTDQCSDCPFPSHRCVAVQYKTPGGIDTFINSPQHTAMEDDIMRTVQALAMAVRGQFIL
jgi:hypothetical protein